MPTVRAYGPRKVQQAALPGERKSLSRDPNAYGAGLGATAARLGQEALAEKAEQRRAQAEKERQRMNEIATLAARNKLDAFENDLMYGDSGLMRRKGEDAFGAYDGFEEAYNKKADELEGGLVNEDQKLAFMRARATRFDSASGKLRQHIAKESESFDKNESEKFIENLQMEATRNYAEPREIAVKLGEVDQAVRAYADRNGMGTQQTEAMVRDAKTKIHQGVIDNLLADDQTAQAAPIYYDAVKEQIAPDKRDEIMKALKTGSIRAQSQKEADKIVAESATQTEALEKVRTIENPELRDATEDRVVRDFQRKKAAEQLTNEDAMTEAGNILDRTNGDIAKIPARQWESFSPSQKAALKAYAKRDEVEGEGGGSGMGQWMRLMEESVSNPEQFKKRDLTKFMGSMPKTELKELQRKQMELRQGKADKALDDFRNVNQVIEGAMSGVIDTSKDKEAKAKITKAVADKQREFQKSGKLATNEDIERFADEAINDQVVIKGSQVWDLNPFNNSDTKVPVLNLQIKDIPTSDRRRIENKLRSLSIPVNDREVLRFFVDENRVR